MSIVDDAVKALALHHPQSAEQVEDLLLFWVRRAELTPEDIAEVQNRMFPPAGGADYPASIEVADGHIVHTCCGKVDDEPHRNFCEHYRPAASAPERLLWLLTLLGPERLAEMTRPLTDAEAALIEAALAKHGSHSAALGISDPALAADVDRVCGIWPAGGVV